MKHIIKTLQTSISRRIWQNQGVKQSLQTSCTAALIRTGP